MGPYVPLGPIAALPERREDTNEFTYLATVPHCLDLPGTSGLLSVSIGSFEAWEVQWGLARNWPQFSVLRLEPRGEPIEGDFDGDGRDDILWYRSGPGAEHLWSGRADRSFDVGSGPSASGTYRPVSGDFDGDTRDDVFWYGPGAGRDHIWTARADLTFASTPTSVAGVYVPIVGDFDLNSRDDVFWYVPGGGYVWYEVPAGVSIPCNGICVASLD